ncbi:hypothetical protein [Rugamonas sp.]|uniref:hypothetical protein n=1 Tax=Rugamonas sp. TaxID=1926287 RepID=UPI0025CDC9D9|nr:hypothetical protein [Rugamonas sp.]
MTTRRSFLKIGVLGALTLAAGGAIYRGVNGAAAPRRYLLDGPAKAVLAAVIPSMLSTMLPADPAARAAAIEAATTRVQGAIAGLPLATQKEVHDLFGLLALAPARRFLAGVPDGWSSATPAAIDAFLQNWRGHRLALLRTAYLAMHDLILGGWYADASTWAAIGYPGPLKELG